MAGRRIIRGGFTPIVDRLSGDSFQEISVNDYVLAVVIVCLASSLMGQNDSSPLQARISELESENQKLRNANFVLSTLYQTRDPVAVEVPIAEGRRAKLLVAKDGWGDALARDVAAICSSTAETILRVIQPESTKEPTILIVPGDKVPMVIAHRGPSGEYVVLLTARDKHWSQFAYQFSHELGHVLCGDLSPDQPQQWFEEAFCESLSIWALEEMGNHWQTKPPYVNWKDYAPHLSSYAKDVRDRVQTSDEISVWYQKNREALSRNAYDRDSNLILAKHLATVAQKDTKFYQSFYYLRRRVDPALASMEGVLGNWLDSCPEELRSGPVAIGQLLGIKPHP